MPPTLALLLCTAFVLFLLRLERRQSADVSAASWIPTLWMLLIASKPLGIWFGSTGDNEAGSLLDRLVLSGLGAAGLMILARRHFDASAFLRRNKWLVALLAYMLVSTLWSDITFIAFKRWVREGIVLIMAMVILSEPNPRRTLESVLCRAVYILIPFSIVLIKYYPALGVDYGRWSGLQMWIGVTLHKNTLGRLCLIAAFFMLWQLYRHWTGRVVVGVRYRTLADLSIAVMALFLLKGAENAYSATSIGTFAVGSASFWLFTSLRRREIAVPQVALGGLVALLIGFGVTTPFIGGSNMASVSRAFGRTETLTGRTDTWAELVPAVHGQPILGSGFGSFWTSARRESYQMSHGHNGYMDILLELGVVGLALYVGLLLSCARKLHSALAADYDWASFGICFLLMAIVYNVTESAMNSLTEQMTAVLVLVSLVAPAHEVVQPVDIETGFAGSPVASQPAA